MSLDPDELEARLKSLEAKLLKLQKELSLTEKIAKQIQNLVTQNRFPQLKGIEFLSRYIPGEQSRAEGFDFFLNSQRNALWFFYFSMRSYGLGTSLFQAYLLLQGRAFFDQSESSPKAALSKILEEFSPQEDPEAKIFVATLKLSTLRWEEANHGRALTVFLRLQEKNSWGPAQIIESPQRENYQISPGSRIFFINKAVEATSLYEIKLNPSSDQLKDDFNSFLYHFEKKEQRSRSPEDICFWAIDINAKKIHLA